MVKKVKICPICKTWTSKDGEKCDVCGTDLIKTEYSDEFFKNTTQDRIDYYINKELGTKENATFTVNGGAEKEDNKEKKSSGDIVISLLFYTGIFIIIGGLVIGMVMGTQTVGYYYNTTEFSWKTAFVYWFSFGVAGLILIGFSDALQYLKDIRNHICKKED